MSRLRDRYRYRCPVCVPAPPGVFFTGNPRLFTGKYGSSERTSTHTLSPSRRGTACGPPEAAAATQSNGSVPMSAQREVYATIWCGSAATAYFSGFQVLLHSIRQHDEHRPIVVLMDGATNCTPTADGPLLDDIAERHAPLIFKHVNVPVRNKHCLRSMRGPRVNGSRVASRLGLKYTFLKFAWLNMTQFRRSSIGSFTSTAMRWYSAHCTSFGLFHLHPSFHWQLPWRSRPR